jgi:GAF domain-containing protein
VSADRLLRIVTEVTAAASSGAGTAHLCEVSRKIVDVSGAGIMLMSGGVQRGSLCTTDSVSSTIEELQFTLGEGPCLDAYRHRRPVLEPDLFSPHEKRWPVFSAAALEVGVRAVFGFPIELGETRVGALNLYRDSPGPLTDDQHGDASLLADVAAQAIVDMQAEAASGVVAAALERDADLQLVVHQATGMVSAQLEIPVTDALDRLRAFAFAHHLSLGIVAARVVRRELRFDDADG